MSAEALLRIVVMDQQPVSQLGIQSILKPFYDIEPYNGVPPGQLDPKPVLAIIGRFPPGREERAAFIRSFTDEGIPMIAILNEINPSDAENLSDLLGLGVSVMSRRYQPEEIIEAVRFGTMKGRGLDPDLSKALTGTVAKAKKPSLLTPRQLEVMSLAAKGFRAREIAQEIGIGKRTVDNHMAQVYRRIGVRDRSSAIVYLLRKGVITF